MANYNKFIMALLGAGAELAALYLAPELVSIVVPFVTALVVYFIPNTEE